MMKTRESRNREADLLDRARTYLPGGILTSFGDAPDPQLVVERGAGARIYDHSGNEYIDYLMGAGVQILGHAHPRVVQAASECIGRGTSYYALNEPAILLAEELCRVIPCAEMVKFWTSGSEATSHAIRLARAFTKRDKIVKLEGAWLGGHDTGLMSIAPQNPPEFPQPVPDSAGIPASVANEVLIAPFNDLERTSSIIKKFANEISAVVLEPYQRYIAPVPGFLEGLRELTEKLGILLIFDEIVSGFRFLYGGVQELYEVTPDLAAFGKIIGGGFPLSAVCGRRDIMKQIDPQFRGTEKFVHSVSTFSGYPVAPAAGYATLQELKKPGVYAQLHEYGAKLRQGLAESLRRHNLPFQVMGEGPIFHVLFTDEKVVDYRSSLHANSRLLFRFTTELLRRGILKGPKGYISTAHTDQDLKTTFTVIDQVAELLARERSH